MPKADAPVGRGEIGGEGGENEDPKEAEMFEDPSVERPDSGEKPVR